MKVRCEEDTGVWGWLRSFREDRVHQEFSRVVRRLNASILDGPMAAVVRGAPRSIASLGAIVRMVGAIC